MLEDGPMSQYAEWPAGATEREAAAREILGRHLVAAYDGCLNVASEMLFEGYRYKSPSEEQRRFLDWIQQLGDADRQSAFAFVRQMVHLGFFSILNSLDGSAGCILQESA